MSPDVKIFNSTSLKLPNMLFPEAYVYTLGLRCKSLSLENED